MIPSYRERLRAEGAMLAAAGAVAGVLVIALTDEATQNMVSTVVQLAIVAALMATLGVRSVRRSMAAAVPLDPDDAGTGEPTPLWLHPLIVAGLTLGFGVPAGWDAGLRVGGGCVIVGLAQAVLFERLVAREEQRRAARFHRVKGSSLFTGTRLGTLP
jgi:hypothetical protein